MKQLLFTAFIAASLATTAFGQATQSGGTLLINTPNTDDSFTVEVGPTPGTLQIFGAPGIVDGAAFRGVTNIVIRTNGGFDKVNVKVESTVVPSLDINTGAGISEVDLDFKVFPTVSASSTIRYVGGDDIDKVLIECDSAAQRLTTNWNIDARGGLNEGFAYVQSNDPSLTSVNTINIFGGADLDNWTVQAGVKSNTLRMNVGGNLGAGMDNLNVLAKGNITTTATLVANMDLGLGMDKLGIDFAEVATTNFAGAFRAGGDADVLEAKFSGLLQGTGILDAGDGDDLTVVNADRVAGSLRLLMGAGNDFTEFNAGTFAGTPSSDGGLGFDAFKGIGRAVNYEQIN
jgi:hypothetical protein